MTGPSRASAARADWSVSAPFRFAVGIEDTFVAHESAGHRRLDEYELTQHYECWAEDLRLVAASGADSVRWGIPWHRVEPSPGRFDWSWVDRVVDRITDLGLTCVVDLMHYGTPLWLEGAFAHRDYPRRVAEYAASAAQRYGDRLHVWTPLNEPIINAVYCGERGLWPPCLTGDRGFVTVLLQVAEGVSRTQRAIADVQPDASFVHVDAGFCYEGAFPRRELLEERRFLGLDLPLGRVERNHALTDWLLRHGADEARLCWFRDHPVEPDVVGVNYYPAFTTVRFDGERELGVESGVGGLEELVRLYAERYDAPVMVTETSRGGTVGERSHWLADSLACVAGMRADGVPLVGYTWFPFLALVDWRYRESDLPVADWLVQMGLVDLEQEPAGRLSRVPTRLVEEFRAAAVRGLP
jgi:beta-glucosidase